MCVVFSLETGGLERVVINLCNRLDIRRFRPSICVFQSGGGLEDLVDRDRVELLTVERRLNNDPTLPFRLAWQLRRSRIDIVQTQSWGTLVEGVVAAKLARTPAILHCEHGILEERGRNIPIQRLLWKMAGHVAAVAEPLADRMASTIGYARDRIQVVPNGVDTDRFRPQPGFAEEWRRDFGFPPKGFLIGTAARLVPLKNHLGLLRGLAHLEANGTSAYLAIAGDGPLRDELEQVAEGLGLSDRVFFLGEVVAVERFLNSLDAFVLFSDSEGMSMTVMEAMSCGLPVVTTAVGANSELVADGESGFLVPRGEIEPLTRAILALAEDHSLVQAMGEVGRVRSERHFSLDKMVQRYAELYEELSTQGGKA